MLKHRKKHAFTLAEVMVVLLVLTILFAAFAPFITKRRSRGKTELWLWASRNYLAGPMDTFYQPGNGYNGGIYFGATPDSENDIKMSYLPLSKMTIRSGFTANNNIQRQLQLRYGRSSFDDPGQFAASFVADNRNMLFGGAFPALKELKSYKTYPSDNVGFGVNSLNQAQDRDNTAEILQGNTAFGYNALGVVSFGENNTAIGAGAGEKNISGSRNTMIGYLAGAQTTTDGNTLIGYKSTSNIGNYNTFIGANTGNYREGEDNGTTSSYDFQYNVALGYKALNSITSGKNNVAIGSGALHKLTTGHYNVAIGYNACENIKGESYKTCIGYNSGPAANSPVKTDIGTDASDTTPRTYIGSNPNMDSDGNWGKGTVLYGGDAVMEIHNSLGSGNSHLINDPSIISNTTTIINGNLIVRGRAFFTVGNVLYPFYYANMNGKEIYGTNITAPCATNQGTYSFVTSGYCSGLSSISATSDRRLKTIVGKNNDGLDKINQLKIYNYTFKNDKDKKPHVGVIAQELQKIFPNSVSQDENGYFKIRWDEMFYAAINSIKELNTKITKLVKQNLSIGKKITKLEKRNQYLKQQINILSNRVDALKRAK